MQAVLDDSYTTPATVFRFTSPRHVIYGRGAATHFADPYAALLGNGTSNLLVITDQELLDTGVISDAVASLEDFGRRVEVYAREPGEPTASAINALGAFTRGVDPAGIVAIGGGATMDSAKSARVLCQFGGRIEDYEGIDRIPAAPQFPLAAVATTSGTGSETSYAALYTDEATSTKRFVGSTHLIPDIAVVDPELTLSVPPATTAYTGLDALAQAVGPFLSPLRHPLTDVLSLEAVMLISRNLLTVFRNGSDLQARCAMAYGSLLMGLAMNNAECIGEHFFAEVVGPRYGLPHGMSVAMFLPYILQFNRHVTPQRLARLSEVVVDDASADEQEAIDQLITFVVGLLDAVAIPTLEAVGVQRGDLEDLADQVVGHIGIELGLNPRPMSRADCVDILTAAFDEVPALEMSV